MKTQLFLVTFFCVVIIAVTPARAQQFDIAFGFGTVTGTDASDASSGHTPQSISGGGYPSFSGDFLFFKKYFGVGGQVAWRANQNVDVFFTPYRPILYDFNGIYAPPLGKHVQAEFQAGIGGESLRFYTPFVTCNFVSCTNFVSSNHFLGHFGGGLRLYVTRSIFIRPEAHLYLVNNNFEFAGPRVNRYTVSIGYSLKNQF